MATELAKAPCLNCEAAVLLKVNRSSRVYYDCNGNHDRKACGSRHVFGATDSENFINKFGSNDDGNQGTEDHERGSETGDSGSDGGTGKGKPGGTGLFD